MNKKITLEAINDYLDGTLSPDATIEFEALLAEDEAARQEVETLREILDGAASLPAEIAPDRDLWSGIEHRISASTQAPQRSVVRRWLGQPILRPMGYAAAAILVVLPLLHLLRANQASPPDSPTDRPTRSLSQAFNEADQVYRQARIDVLAPLHEADTPVSEETLRVIQENLNRIDQAVAEIQGALLEAPDSARLVKLLIATREKERNLLQQLGHLSQPT